VTHILRTISHKDKILGSHGGRLVWYKFTDVSEILFFIKIGVYIDWSKLQFFQDFFFDRGSYFSPVTNRNKTRVEQNI
jgi:hypothetical protein